jgi:hypothetical protein
MNPKSVNPGNHPIKGLNECEETSPLQTDLNNDDLLGQCPNGSEDSSLKDLPRDLGWLEDAASKKVGIGWSGNCDPMQTGQIVEDLQKPNREVIYRHSKGIRGSNEGMLKLFNDIVVIDENGKAWPVPIIWGTQEKAVQFILADNVRKDDSLVVDRIRLPMLAIHNTDIQFDQTRYIYHKALDYMNRYRPDRKPGFTVNEKFERDTVFGVARGIPVNITYNVLAWTLYLEDMDQIVEQVMLKFSPVAYIRVRGVHWETMVTLDSVANNIEFEPGDKQQRVIKFQFNMTTQTYIPQPIVRKKAVLKMRTSIYNEVDEENITEVLGKLEHAIEEFES